MSAFAVEVLCDRALAGAVFGVAGALRSAALAGRVGVAGAANAAGAPPPLALPPLLPLFLPEKLRALGLAWLLALCAAVCELVCELLVCEAARGARAVLAV